MSSTVGHVFVGAVRSTEGGRGGVFRQAIGSQRWDALSDGVADGAEVRTIEEKLELEEQIEVERGDQLQDHDAETTEEGQAIGQESDGKAPHAVDTPLDRSLQVLSR